MIPSSKKLTYAERLRSRGLPSLEYWPERANMIQVYNRKDQLHRYRKTSLVIGS